MTRQLTLPKNWMTFLGADQVETLLGPIRVFLDQQDSQSKTIYPDSAQIFRAFELCPPEQCRCVILGQDPYHGEGQAHGLAFSVDAHLKLPPSLKNIFKEYQDDLDLEAPANGDLKHWAQEGVLLLNTVLTVEHARPASHFKRGWEKFTDHVITKLGERTTPLVFILWGAPSQKKKELIKKAHHLLLEAPHPSPLSSYRGFFGSKPFSQTNKFLKENQLPAINWKLD